ncbi:GspE/PulE family protein [Sulfurovum sp. NBC37-1]|uniref:GspE/PulE family protein n=1 Tax=Sulfurovum sp. (strain NBC37-1) TaxID=387093 RepID=UPI0001587736|nr:GspE/PulE family protein [Sulfurovum sp. NBC37-1]BAF70992.1 type II secretion system protein E [Sulfurovum sp. NBC37-1]
MQFPKLQDVNLEPLWEESINHKIALKHSLLFSTIEDIDSCVVQQETLADALNYLAKLSVDYPVVMVDTESFVRLKNKFLEIQTGSDFEEMPTTSEELIEAEGDLLDFIRNSQDLLSSEESAPIIKLVNSLFFQAIKKGASDIHIESGERKGEVRLRIDGALKKHLDLEKSIINLVINRIKVISSLDISEKRVPQDGRTQISISGKTLDVRVSVLPTYYGERVVMRILMQSEHIPSLQELGFAEDLTEDLYKLLNHAHGMILVTGPTGSGKSTTLHAFLQHIATPDKNIITVEDPVEYNASNISQIQVNTKVGLTFAAGLRSILRQDPDIIMVGEIRDSETADIALRSALTGHLLLSTLHTNDSTSSLSRLMDMGIENFLISATLLGVLAQRLTRKLCVHCKEKALLPSAIAEEISVAVDKLYFRAVGCKECDFTGYKGRQAIGELFIIDDRVKEMMKDGFNDHQVREVMKKNGMKTIADKLKEMLLSGETSYEEALRVGLMDG